VTTKTDPESLLNLAEQTVNLPEQPSEVQILPGAPRQTGRSAGVHGSLGPLADRLLQFAVATVVAIRNARRVVECHSASVGDCAAFALAVVQRSTASGELVGQASEGHQVFRTSSAGQLSTPAKSGGSR
jgi:hypothetical protein